MKVHGNGFTFVGLKNDLYWIRDLMDSWFDIKVRGIWGGCSTDHKEIVILERIVRWTPN